MFKDLTKPQILILRDFFSQGELQLKNLSLETLESPELTDDPELDEFFDQASTQIIYINLPPGMSRNVYADKLGEALTALFKDAWFEDSNEMTQKEYKEIVEKIVHEIKYYG